MVQQHRNLNSWRFNTGYYVTKYIASVHIIAMIFLGLTSCEKKKKIVENFKLYRTVTSKESGIDFGNYLEVSEELNFFKYSYFYNGAGVAVGDIDNDGLQDIFLVGNMVGNKLYLNQGDLKFEDITLAAGITDEKRWHAGVTMGDVNGDGYLDIYVSVTGSKDMERQNLLYLNNQDKTFTECSVERGISCDGYSYQSTFFDYDKDGDLDLFVANYPPSKFYNPASYFRQKMDSVEEGDADRLFENDGKGFFKDVTVDAGLHSYGLSLGATVGDLNKNGWPDLYVSNDFFSPDYMYLNKKNGTFLEVIKETTKHFSFYGMGVDIADFNNDGLMDIVQAEMNPSDNFRSKSNMGSMNAPLFWEAVSMGFHFQYMQNSLQMNQGIRENGLPFFSEISRMAGISSTDWSWASLFMDMDNDGWKDIFITNGIRKDINNKDFFKKVTNPEFLAKYRNYKHLVEDIPFSKVSNNSFKNTKGLKFEDTSSEWGLDFKGFSNGTAYSDLDNDGDLDIVVNNIDDKALLFENRSSDYTENRYLRLKLNGPSLNPFGLGTKVILIYNGMIQVQELTLTRGYLSSVEPIIHFGTGLVKNIDKVKIIWPDGKEQVLSNVHTNQLLSINYDKSVQPNSIEKNHPSQIFAEVEVNLFKHIENEYNDFEKEPLLPHKTSQFGPGLAVGDVNGDGLEDFYVGGATGFKGQVFIQNPEGKFDVLKGPWEKDKAFEDIGATFFDADQDGDLDLYIVSGGNEFEKNSPLLADRLYLNKGDGKFIKLANALPEFYTSGSCVVPFDFDQDGDLDLFIGGRIVPGHYPLPPRSYLLENVTSENKIKFKDVTQKSAPEILHPGLVTSAVATDFDNDGDEDLVIVGEWMPISFFENNQGLFNDVTKKYNMQDTTGWWFSVIADDFDGDGDEDIAVGNLGLNYKYQASEKETFDIYAYDYDKNERLDIVLGYYNQGIQYPVRGRECSSEQIPSLTKKFRNYTDFANASLTDVYTPEALEASIHYRVKIFSSVYIENLGMGQMKRNNLPELAQISNINGMVASDFNDDGNRDLVIVGNLFVSEVETPRNDASYGLFLEGDGQGSFKAVDYSKSGIYVPGDARAASLLKGIDGDLIIIANNNGPLQMFKVNR